MKIQYKIIGLSILGGILSWIIDAGVDTFFFYEGPFLKHLISDIFMRSTIVALFLIFGIIISKFVVKQRKSDDEELEKYRFHREDMVKEEISKLTLTNENLRREVHQRKKAEKCLQISEERWRKYFELGLIGIAITSSEKKWIEVNDYLCRILGYSRQELMKMTWAELTYPENLESDLAKFNRMVRGEVNGIKTETRFIRKDGKIIDVSISTRCLRNQDGEIECYIVLIQDITDRKQAEKALRQSETKFRTVFENAGSAIFIADTETGNILDCNKLAEKLIGRPREEIIGMHQSELHTENEKEKYKARFASHIKKGGHTLNFEGEVQHKDGRRIPVYITGRVMQIEGKKIIVGFFFDVTERKKMEEELMKVQKLEAIGVLAGGIAHDFNNLLTAVLGNLSLIELYAKSGEDIFEILDETKKAAQQTSHLTQQLLTFSKGGKPIREVASILDLLEESVNFALSGSKVKCDLSIQDDLWWSEIDKGQITQVIGNLIINAEQAMPQGGIIEVNAENVIVRPEDGLPLQQGKYIKILIRDKGTGIPEEYLPRIFDPYFTTRQKRSGLGLSIAYSIIQKHGGHITVNSKIESGTTFSIYLPASERDAFRVQKVEEKRPISGKGKILFMDDQKNIKNMIKKMLTHIGYEVEFAGDGVEAIEIYKKKKESGQAFDAVILDLTVPGGMGGKECLRKLLEINPYVRAIVSSGYSNNLVMAEYKNYGFKGVVAKPYEIQQLSEVLYKVLNEKEENGST